jgi:hypothetical protein
MDIRECVKIWNRMCGSVDCGECPVGKYGCNPMETADHLDEVEKALIEWDKEHPEKIYPTILEVLRYIAMHIQNGTNLPLNELVKLRMPEEVAKEFGIVPINECGLSKYVLEDEEEVKSEWR